MVIPLILNTTAVPFYNEAPQPLNLNPNQRSIISELMNEAASAIVDVIRQPEIRSVSINTDLTVPPNTPNTDQTFEFPDVQVYTSEDSDFENVQAEKMLKKRKRIPSFKRPRVLRKKLLFKQESADDEASSTDDQEELSLKLNLLSEATSSSSDTESEDIDDPQKWAKIGEELRIIADRFSDEIADPEEDPSNKSTDLLSLVNLMLPVSVPRSLWSALLSYAAWKIFKKFQ